MKSDANKKSTPTLGNHGPGSQLRAPTMEPHDSDFKKDPKAFAEANALVPYGTTAVPGSNFKKDTDTDKETAMLRARGQHRVGFGEIKSDPNATVGLVMQISEEYKPDKIPLYWLPYDPQNDNITTMIRLKPSKQLTEGHWASEEIHDPKWFVTWGLNGCMITISGDPKEPTLYHSPQVEDVSQKVATFDFEYWKAKGSASNSNPFDIGPAQYGAYFGEDGGRLTHDQDAFSERSVTTIKNKTRITEGATLFGERQENGDWHFFCQEWAQIIWEKWRLGTNPEFKERLVRRCYKVWPSAQMTPATLFVNRVPTSANE